MDIDNLIERLIYLKSQGATVVNVIDTDWNDYDIDEIASNQKGTEVVIMVAPVVI